MTHGDWDSSRRAGSAVPPLATAEVVAPAGSGATAAVVSVAPITRTATRASAVARTGGAHLRGTRQR